VVVVGREGGVRIEGLAVPFLAAVAAAEVVYGCVVVGLQRERGG